ncbi:MAG: hypothetical protein ACI4Q3_03655, partial [Kiritimatiellia bacterium]
MGGYKGCGRYKECEGCNLASVKAFALVCHNTSLRSLRSLRPKKTAALLAGQGLRFGSEEEICFSRKERKGCGGYKECEGRSFASRHVLAAKN